MSEQDKPEGGKNAVRIQIEMDDETAQGQYVNLVLVNHTETEFTIDLMYLQPQQPKAKVRTRAILSPQNTKRLLMALQDNLRLYEQRFNKVEIQGTAPPSDFLQ